MKKLIFVFALLILILTGCDNRKYNILNYQDKSIVAKCTVNEKYSLTVEKENSTYRIKIDEPKKLRGVEFEIGDEYALVKTDTVKIEIDKSKIKGICALSQMFSLSESALTSTTEKGQESTLTFENTLGCYTVTVGKNSMPKHITIFSPAYSYEITVDEISVK